VISLAFHPAVPALRPVRRSSTSATGSSKASTIWVSAATAVCGLTCLIFDRVAFFALARLGVALAAGFLAGLTVFFAAGRMRALPIADDFRLRAVVRFFRCAIVAPVLLYSPDRRTGG
jgi:hypothetical protein